MYTFWQTTVKTKHFLFLSFLGIVLSSCKKEDNIPYEQPQEVLPFLKSFEEEAAKRGYDYSTSLVYITFDELEEGRAGEANLGGGWMKIDRSIWNTSTYEQREQVVFHELGHCLLSRWHRNSLLPDNQYASIMRGDCTGGSCDSEFPDNTYKKGNIDFKGRRREYYLDELFDKHTPAPAWLNAEALSKELKLNNCIQLDMQGATFNFSEAFDSSFTVEFWFKTYQEKAPLLYGFEQAPNNLYDYSGWGIQLENGRINGFAQNHQNKLLLNYDSLEQVWDGQWHHFALVVYSSGGYLNYLDGKRQQMDSSVLNITAYSNKLNSLKTITGFMYGFIGQVDELRIWNTSRTSGEIISNINTEISSGSSGLKAYWRFNGNLQDETGKNTITLTGTGNSSLM